MWGFGVVSKIDKLYKISEWNGGRNHVILEGSPKATPEEPFIKNSENLSIFDPIGTSHVGANLHVETSIETHGVPWYPAHGIYSDFIHF